MPIFRLLACSDSTIEAFGQKASRMNNKKQRTILEAMASNLSLCFEQIDITLFSNHILQHVNVNVTAASALRLSRAKPLISFAKPSSQSLTTDIHMQSSCQPGDFFLSCAFLWKQRSTLETESPDLKDTVVQTNSNLTALLVTNSVLAPSSKARSPW